MSSANDAPAGQAYFISDGTPVDNFEFLRPIVTARRKMFPTIVLPVPLALCVAFLLERVHLFERFLSRALPSIFSICHVEPMLTRAEVLKVGVTHYFSIDKARRDLQYFPIVSSTTGAERMATHYAQTMLHSPNYFEVVRLGWWVAICTGMTLLALIAYDVFPLPIQAMASIETSPVLFSVSSVISRSYRFCGVVGFDRFWMHVGVLPLYPKWYRAGAVGML